MHSEIQLAISASPDRIYQLAAAVERWPDLLPHYRYVTVLHEDPFSRLVRMGARRDWIPVSWTSIQRLYPDDHRVEFRHVRGATTGMTVEWRINPVPGGSLVQIEHWFEPGWPIVGGWPTDLIVGRYFVEGIARRTLSHLREIAESTPADETEPETPGHSIARPGRQPIIHEPMTRRRGRQSRSRS